MKRENITAMRKQCREEGEYDSDDEAEYHGFPSRLRKKIETPSDNLGLRFIRAVSGRCLAVKIILMVMGTMVVIYNLS